MGRQSEIRNDIFIRVSRTLSCIYLMYCVFMLSVTALYYHTLPQKAIAVFIAVSSFWALKFVFRKIKVKPITAINESKRTDYINYIESLLYRRCYAIYLTGSTTNLQARI